MAEMTRLDSAAKFGLFYQGMTLTTLVFGGVAHAETHRQKRGLSSAQWHIKPLQSFDGKMGFAPANAMVIPQFAPEELAEAMDRQNLIDQVAWTRLANHLDGCPVRETRGIAKCRCQWIALEQGLPSEAQDIEVRRESTRWDRIQVLD